MYSYCMDTTLYHTGTMVSVPYCKVLIQIYYHHTDTTVVSY